MLWNFLEKPGCLQNFQLQVFIALFSEYVTLCSEILVNPVNFAILIGFPLYHQIKDIIYVKDFLGHKRIEDTMLYIQVAEAIFNETNDEFTVRIAKKPAEIQELLEVGFEYVCEKDDLLYFRKRK